MSEQNSETKGLSHASDNAVDRALLQWALTSGDTGLSSECMAAHLTGLACDGSYPSDPDDLGRCLRLLAVVPALRERLPKMAEVNAVWAALIARWSEIEQSMKDEVGIALERGRSAPKTYQLMKSIIRPIEDAGDDIIVRFDGVTVKRGRGA